LVGTIEEGNILAEVGHGTICEQEGFQAATFKFESDANDHVQHLCCETMVDENLVLGLHLHASVQRLYLVAIEATPFLGGG